MTNLIEKSINLGLGLFAYSREKVEEIVEDLVSKGEISKKDAHEFASDLIKRGKSQRKELTNLIRNEISEALSHVNIAKKEDVVTKSEINEIIRKQVIQVLHEQGVTKAENS